MGTLMRAHDWAATPLGAPHGWPAGLKALVGVMLHSSQPMFIAWGQERTLLYNDAYAEILARKHPRALGRDFLNVWREIRADLLPIVEQAYAGEPVHMDDITLVMERRDHPEETHFSFSYTPVRDESGAVAGFFCPCTEITRQVMAEAIIRYFDFTPVPGGILARCTREVPLVAVSSAMNWTADIQSPCLRADSEPKQSFRLRFKLPSAARWGCAV